MNLSLHSSTKQLVAAVMAAPPQALLITGPYGIGATTLADHIAHELSKTVITVLPEKDDVVDLEKGIISVALVRRLYEQTRTIIESRVVIIDYAERMAPTAQNAFLKLLEEPNSSTYFILVTHEPQTLLPTVLSRTQRLDMLPITREASESMLDTLKISDATKRTQLLYMATGLPARLARLAGDQTYFDENAQLVRDARDLLQGSTYTKLVLAHKYKDNRMRALELLDTAMNMLRQSLTGTEPTTTVKLAALLCAYDLINANGNIRLQLTHIVL